jgi:hypothetical protein
MGTRPPRPAQPQALRLDVARVAREKGVLSKRGPMAGQPSVDALRRGAGIGYATAHELLRWPNRLARIDLSTLERVAQFYGVHPATRTAPTGDQPTKGQRRGWAGAATPRGDWGAWGVSPARAAGVWRDRKPGVGAGRGGRGD